MPSVSQNIRVASRGAGGNVGGTNLGQQSTPVQVDTPAVAPQVAPVEQPSQQAGYVQPVEQGNYTQPTEQNYYDQASTQQVLYDAPDAVIEQPRVQPREEVQEVSTPAPPQTAAEAAGFNPASQPTTQDMRAIQDRVPVLDVSAVGDLDVQSSRTQSLSGKNFLDAYVEANSEHVDELAEGEDNPINPDDQSDISINREGMETLDAYRQLEEALRSTSSGVEEVPPIDDRPDSIFNRPFGYDNDGGRVPRTKQPTLRRVKSMIDKMKKQAARAFKREGVGYRVYGKILANTNLGFRDIGVGIQEVMAAARQDPTMLNNLLNAYVDKEVDVEQFTSGELAAFINSHEIYVGTFKPPNNRGQDIQRRRLRVMMTQQRGIYLHPIMAAMYTADYDGDDMEISFDPRVARYAKDAMDYMVGIDNEHSLNMDFLPVTKILPMDKMSVDEYIQTVMLSSLPDFDTTSLNKAIVKLGESAELKGKDGEKKQSEAYREVFREARRVADRASGGDKTKSDSIMSDLCMGVYRGMKDIQVQNALTTIGADLPDVGLRSYDDSAIIKFIDGIVDGKVPNNFQDLKIMLSGFIGNVEGKNAPFRFTADVGKMVKMDSRLKIGDGSYQVDPNDNEQMLAFFESTVKFAASERMAKEVKKAGRSQYYTEELRRRVIQDVGFPEKYNTFQEFLVEFRKSYAKHSAMINQANLVFLTNLGISSDSNGLVSPLRTSEDGLTFSDLAEPMLSIYGTYSVGRIFQGLSTTGVMASDNVDKYWQGNPDVITNAGAHGSDTSRPVEREYDTTNREGFWITGRYLNYSLHQFKNENRITRGKGEMSKFLDQKFDRMDRLTNSDAQFYMLMAIADKRTSSASAFNKKVYGDAGMSEEGARNKTKPSKKGEITLVKMMSSLLVELDVLNKQESNRRDQMRWVEDVVNTLIISGPDMFNHFGMDSPAGFLASKWARKLVEHARDVEKLGGIRTAMIFDYRMGHINKLLAEMPDPDADVLRYVDAYNNLEFAKDELAASSEVWHGIIQEFMAEASNGQKSVFQMMRDNANLPVSQRLSQASLDGARSYEWNVAYDAGSFWANVGEHDNLRSVIEDLDMDRQTKWNIIADVVRYWEHDAYFKSWEVGYQLEIGNDSSYSLNGGAMQSALGTFNDFSKSYTRWGKTNYTEIQKNIYDAADLYDKSDQRGRLMYTLQRLDSAPWELIEIDDDMYADSIVSVLDKTYAQTEKASQHPWTNAIYAALSYQRNGGYMNDITRTDDRTLGIQNANSIGVQDVIHLLANPEAELYVYNQYGEYALLSREILLTNALGRELSNDIESDIWEFLKKEPRIASAIRKHNACVKTDSDGGGYLGAALSTTETITNSTESALDPLGHVKYLMRDHPIYAGIISMACPAYGAITRNHRKRIAQMEQYFAYQIYTYASSSMTAEGSAQAILEDLGITDKSLKNVMRSNYDKFLELQGLPTTKDNGESDADAAFTYSVAASNLAKYIEQVRKNVNTTMAVPRSPKRPEKVGVDVSSVASFWDVLQELGGAKTSVSTGIEGAETYQFAEWASHITLKDEYADLEAVFRDVDPSWNGLWTNAVNDDNSPILLQVSEDGTIENYRELMEAKESQKLSEIVVKVPDGYQVQDRSTDTHGTPVASLFMYMVSKRSNGAEAFNLKAKKAGLDGKDSVTKMQGKYRMVTRIDPETGEERQYRASFFDTLYELRQVAQQNGENGLQAAKMHLAKMLMQENRELGYDDMTLSNYMSMADVMLIEGEDGHLYLRSLEMLFTAIKYRIGAKVDEMSDKDIRAAADAIVHNASETGVGISMMNSMDALDNIRPSSKASSTSGIKPNASVFARNYNLLQQIEKTAKKYGVGMMEPVMAEQLTNRFTDIEPIGEMVNRLDVMRNYNIVGHAGFKDLDEEIHWSIGPEQAIVIGDDDINSSRVLQICKNAAVYGMTVFVDADNLSKIPKRFAKDAMPCSENGDVILPFFDMRLNGAESSPYNGGRFAIFQAPFSRYVTSVEDSINEYELGDAQARPTRRFVNRIKLQEKDSKKIKAEELFPNVFRNPAYRYSNTTVTFASGNEVKQLIANGVRCTIDYGVVEGGNGFEQRKHDVDAAISRYQQRFEEANKDGMMMTSELKPGDIVAWAKVEIQDQYSDNVQYVLAPIIPFPLHGPTKGIPEKFKLEQVVTTDNDNTLFSVDWYNTSDITNSFAKYFDSSGGANKGMVDFSDAIEDELLLRDGTPVDVYIAKASTDSRKIGTDRRIKTMISLMALARMHGYNFANVDGSFPDNPELKESLLSGRVPTSTWSQLLDGDNKVNFISDARMNAFLNYECKKILADGGNPTDYLMNTYTDENGEEQNTHVMWEFEAMFDQGLNYEDSLLRFLHIMDPKLCPDGVDDSGDYLFRFARDGNDLAKGYNSGVLQMQVPHRLSDGRTIYLWDNVYIGMSFFGEDYSGFSRPNIDGASNFLDGMNTMSYYGVELDKQSAHHRAMWATADIGRVPKDGGAIGKA